MKGDFSRITFDPSKNFTSVLMQQGRVQLDADWNEQAAIVLWQIRALARAVLGEAAGTTPDSFKITLDKPTNQLHVTRGLYFVHGIACETDGTLPVDIPARLKNKDQNQTLTAGERTVYLAVWERIVTYLDDPDIQEVALGAGVDTTVRTKIGFHVTVREKQTPTRDVNGAPHPDATPSLIVTLKGGAPSTDICNISPDSKYRGAGNYLYRVEIHSNAADKPQFKWSRENASVVFPVVKAEGQKLVLATAGRDDRLGLQNGDFLEFESTDIPWTEALPLSKVLTVNSAEPSVTVDQIPAEFLAAKAHRVVRRWDHSQSNSLGLTDAVEGKTIELEAGLQIKFQSNGGAYRRGEYWLIPARTSVEWNPSNAPMPARKPNYFETPLADFTVDDKGKIGDPISRRSVFESSTKPV